MRTIWYITGLAVLMTAVILGMRNARDPEQVREEELRRLAYRDIATELDAGLIDTMVALLKEDPRARRLETRELVERVAALAEQGITPCAETFYALGLRLYGQRRLEASEQAYRRATELRPEWSWAQNGLGIALHAQGKRKDAETAFRRAIALDPQWSRPHNDVAILLRMAGQMEEAEREALVAVELAPDSVAAHNNYGNLLVALGRFDAAEQEYRKAIELDPEHPAPYYNFACLNSLRNHIEGALEYLGRAIELDEAFREEARKDKDLAPLRGEPRFRRLVYGEEDTPETVATP